MALNDKSFWVIGYKFGQGFAFLRLRISLRAIGIRHALQIPRHENISSPLNEVRRHSLASMHGCDAVCAAQLPRRFVCSYMRSAEMTQTRCVFNLIYTASIVSSAYVHWFPAFTFSFFLFFMLNGKWLPDRRDFIRLPYISLCFFFYSEEYDHSARDVLDSFESREHNRSPFVTKTKTLGPSCLLISFSHRAAKALMKYWPESFHNCFSFCA
jgi:hypothetical protein